MQYRELSRITELKVCVREFRKLNNLYSSVWKEIFALLCQYNKLIVITVLLYYILYLKRLYNKKIEILVNTCVKRPGQLDIWFRT